MSDGLEWMGPDEPCDRMAVTPFRADGSRMSWREQFLQQALEHGGYTERAGTEVWLDALLARGWVESSLVNVDDRVFMKTWRFTALGRREWLEMKVALGFLPALEPCINCGRYPLHERKDKFCTDECRDSSRFDRPMTLTELRAYAREHGFTIPFENMPRSNWAAPRQSLPSMQHNESTMERIERHRERERVIQDLVRFICPACYRTFRASDPGVVMFKYAARGNALGGFCSARCAEGGHKDRS